jgi:hypothetical protein
MNGELPSGRLRKPSLRAQRQALGICVQCTMVPAAPGRRRCQPCLARLKTAAQHRRAHRRAEGKCLDCEQPAFPGRIACHKHGRAVRLRQRVNMRRRGVTKKQWIF